MPAKKARIETKNLEELPRKIQQCNKFVTTLLKTNEQMKVINSLPLAYLALIPTNLSLRYNQAIIKCNIK